MQKKINRSLKLIADHVERFPNIVMFSSFGKDSVVTLHLCQRINPNIKVVSVMTPYKPVETITYKMDLETKWAINCVTYEAELLVENDKNLYDIDVERCCDYYKVQPTKKAISELNIDCWISGLRGTEGHTRKFLDEIEVKDGLVKVNPIIAWTEAEIWLYHAINNIPVHPLYAQGYRSLGCAPCSLPYQDGERGGRWKGTGKEGMECGIHTKNLKK